MKTKTDRRAAAAFKARNGMRTQSRWWHAVANSQVKRGAMVAPTQPDPEYVAWDITRAARIDSEVR
jgi:hypothetical protein